eukprot:Gb_30693 [translate_table: standard]
MGMKVINIIWNIKDQSGNECTIFYSISRAVIQHYKGLYKDPQRENIKGILATTSFFDGWLTEEQNEALMNPISKEELHKVLLTFQARKAPSPHEWTANFFVGFWDLMAEDLLAVVEESRITGKVHVPFNTTFIANILKEANPIGFDQYRPISLCNYVYKLISELIAGKFKPILSVHISPDQFGFLDDRVIHDAIGVAQETLHTIKSKARFAFMVKIDLSKAFDKVNWLFFRLILTQVIFSGPMIN